MPEAPQQAPSAAAIPTQPVLITGAHGFVGANLCHYFLARGWQVVGTEGMAGADWRLQAHPRLRTCQVDITDADSLQQTLQAVDPALIVNCAAFGAYASQHDPSRIYQVNFQGVQLLLEAARSLTHLRAFVQLGSSSEYGTNCQAPSETDPAWPDSHYAVSKVAAANVVRFYAGKYDLPAFVLRLYSVYGPLEDASRLIPRLLAKAQEGRLPPLADPNISRDFVYVDDVCAAVAALYRRVDQLQKGDFYNIGSGVCTRLSDLVATSCDLFPMREAPRWGSMAARHWDHPDWYANPRHAQSSLQWSAKTSLRDGLQRTMDWMSQHPQLVATAVAHSIVTRA